MKLITTLVIVISFLAYLRQSELIIKVNYVGLEQNEVKSGGNLLENGRLTEFGWARKLTKQVNIDSLNPLVRTLRFKQWDYYHFSTDNTYLGLAFADVGYGQSIQFSFYNFDQQIHIKKDLMILPVLHQKLRLTLQHRLLSEEHYEFSGDGFYLKYNGWIDEHNNDVRRFQIRTDILDVEFKQIYSPQDDIVTLTPMDEQGTKWFYNLKSYNVPMSGHMKLNGTSYDISQGQSGEDWGRGVWNYDTTWFWVTAQGHTIDGRKVGLNLGGGFQSKSSRATEETIFIDKKLYKLQDLVYDYDENDFSKIITIISNGTTKQQFLNADPKLKEGQFFVEFLPIHMNLNTKELIFAHFNMQQRFGLFSGGIVIDNKIIAFDSIVGLLEFNKSKW